MIFTIKPYPFPIDSDYIDISGSNVATGGVRAFVEQNQASIFWTTDIDIDDILNKSYDTVFIDYSSNRTKNKIFTPEDIRRLKSFGIRVVFVLSVASADIRKNYAVQFFDRFSGLPNSSVIVSRYDTDKYLAEFTRPEWQTVVNEQLSLILSLEPDGILIRDLDFYSYSSDLNAYDVMAEYVVSIADKIHEAKVKIFFETRQFISDYRISARANGIVFPFFFSDLQNSRVNVKARLKQQQILSRLLSEGKEIFISDITNSLDQRKEFVQRARRRSFCPILRTREEDSKLDFNLITDHSVFDVTTKRYGWSTRISSLKSGDSLVKFKSGPKLLNTALVRFQPVQWPKLLSLPSEVVLFDDYNLPITNRNSIRIEKQEEKVLLQKLQAQGLSALNLPENRSELKFFISNFGTDFFNKWVTSPVFQKIMDSFTSPVFLRQDITGVFAYNAQGRFDIPNVVCGSEHYMLLIQMHFRRSPIIFAFGDGFCERALAFIIENVENYMAVLNDEPVSLIVASTMLSDPSLYVPKSHNVSIVPLIENLPV